MLVQDDAWAAAPNAQSVLFLVKRSPRLLGSQSSRFFLNCPAVVLHYTGFLTVFCITLRPGLPLADVDPSRAGRARRAEDPEQRSLPWGRGGSCSLRLGRSWRRGVVRPSDGRHVGGGRAPAVFTTNQPTEQIFCHNTLFVSLKNQRTIDREGFLKIF